MGAGSGKIVINRKVWSILLVGVDGDLKWVTFRIGEQVSKGTLTGLLKSKPQS